MTVLPAFCEEQTPFVSCMLTVAGAMKDTVLLDDDPANEAVIVVSPIARLEM